MNYKFIVKNAVNVIGEPDRQIFLVSDYTGEEGPHHYQASILPDTGGLSAAQFVAERLRRPGRDGEPGLSVDDLEVAMEFLEKGNPPPLVSYVKTYVDLALKKALDGERPSPVISNAPAQDIYHTPIRQSSRPDPAVDPQLGRLA